MKGVDSTKQEQSQPRFVLGKFSLDPLFLTVLFMHERNARAWTCAEHLCCDLQSERPSGVNSNRARVNVSSKRWVSKGDCCFSGRNWHNKLPRRFIRDNYETCLYATWHR